MRTNSLLLIVSLFLGLCVALPVYGAGIEVYPSRIDISGTSQSLLRGQFTVSNPTHSVALYDISADAYASSLSLSRKNFLLNGEEKTTVTWEIAGMDPGTYSFNFILTATPLAREQEVIAASGVIIPVSLHIESATPLSWKEISQKSDQVLVFLFLALLVYAIFRVLKGLFLSTQPPKDRLLL